ncbi:hypothetical protein PR048_000127 [Dryococelus australis]|uniref:Uncharacterized protein n=1 Tax=Dryococelus australis TaxID=614101 RepID=A0ABQ9IF13_9NEOP|nr:hypothetical protein PR048_000127 [Dryococelus australis]
MLASHQGEPGSISDRVTPGFLQMGILPDDATGRRVFSGVSRFPRPCFPALLHSHLASPLIGSRDLFVIFAIGSQFERLALHASEPITDLQGKYLVNPTTARCGATANELIAEAPREREEGDHISLTKGATMAERLGCSLPTKANRVQSRAGLHRIFVSGNRAGRYRVFSGISRIPRRFSSRRLLIFHFVFPPPSQDSLASLPVTPGGNAGGRMECVGSRRPCCFITNISYYFIDETLPENEPGLRLRWLNGWPARLPPRRTGFNPRPSPSGFLQVRIVPNDASSRRVFSGIFHSPSPICIPGLLHSHLTSPSSALKTYIVNRRANFSTPFKQMKVKADSHHPSRIYGICARLWK